ncbi:MAG: cell wall-binding repeat-containing protein [Coriobacteriia bacterium]|nr:cell wall-binding repeat-containing protein [Coriobacteriia bacterium]
MLERLSTHGTPLRVALAVALFLVVAPAVLFAVLAPDAYEPDGTPGEAKAISVDGTPQSHTLYSTDGSMTADYDWVSFVPTLGVTYDIRTAADGGVNPDTVLTLYDTTTSTVLAFNDDYFGPFSRIEWTADTTEAVYLEVTDADTYFGSPTPQIGNYSISVGPSVPSITGAVTDDASGDPIGDIMVTAYSKDLLGDWYVQAWTQTAANGSYGLKDLFDGEYALEFKDVTAFDASYATEYYDDKGGIDSADLVTTVDRATTSGIDAQLMQIDSVAGRVTSEHTGSPLANVTVKAWRYDSGLGKWVAHRSALSGTDGSYALSGLGTRSYRVQFVDSQRHLYRTQFWGDWADIEAATDVNAVSGTTVDNIDASMEVTVQRIAARDRYTTAVAIARTNYPPETGLADVVIASGEDRAAADPLAAAGLCWAYDAPLVLVSSNRTPAEVKTYVKQMADANGSVRLHVVGGPVSIPNQRIEEIKTYVGGGRATSERVLSSGSRFDLASAIARRMAEVRPSEFPTTALVANGADAQTFFDALALSAISRSQGAPVLLVRRDEVPTATQLALRQLGLERRIIGGGPNTVSDTVKRQLGAERWWGRTRHDTAADIARHAIAENMASEEAIAIVSKIPDGLSGGAFIGSATGVLLVTSPNDAGQVPASLSEPAAVFLAEHRAHNISCYVLGGTNSVSSRAQQEASLALE